jgi:WD40 repeat protein
MRAFVLTVLLAAGLALAGAYAVGFWTPTWNDPFNFPALRGLDEDVHTNVHPTARDVDLGPLLYKAAPTPPDNPALPAQVTTARDPIVFPANFVVIDRQDISPKPEGHLLFVGKVITESDVNKPNDETRTVDVPMGDGRVERIAYRRWNESNIVEPGEMVCMMDYSLALKELVKAQRQYDISKEDYQAAKATTGEAKSQYDRIMAQFKLRPESVAAEEMSMRKFTWDKHGYEEVAKKFAIEAAQNEVHKASLIYKQHEVRSNMTGKGVIKVIHKHRGDPVRSLEPIVTLNNIEVLRAEGLIDAQYLPHLLASAEARQGRPELKVSLEPVVEQPPFLTLKAHRGEVTSVAFTRNTKAPQILSASENKVLVWSLNRTERPRELVHPTRPIPVTVQVIACCPNADDKHNYVLTGGSDGSIRLWDLNCKDEVPCLVLEKKHFSGITALAFSPDGKYFASGGEDNLIALWETESGKHLYDFDRAHGVEFPHQGAVTSLHFTPQCLLVSASRDNSVRVWEMHRDGAKLLRNLTDRGGTVADLGVSQDGRLMLFDKGRKLQLLALPSGRVVSELSNATAANTFDTLAIFSPDHNASLMLTAGTSEGRLQLWKTPPEGGRGMEVRQFVTKDRSPVTCAAFSWDTGSSKDTTLAVSGSKDGYVYLWHVPDPQTVRSHAIPGLKLDLVEQSIEGGNQARIGVTVRNIFDEHHPQGRLIQGAGVNIVIEE